MREILFRGKTYGDKWVYGDLNHYVKDNNDDMFIRDIAFKYTVCPSTIGQYTGLKDKNGTQVFEGDIMKHNPRSYGLTTVRYNKEEVIFDNGCFGFKINDYFEAIPFNDSEFGVVLNNEIIDYEVVGNIHDNPELLKED